MVRGSAHGGDVRAEVVGKLHGGRADGTRGAVDENGLPGTKARVVSQEGQCRERSVEDCRGLGEAQARGLVSNHAILSYPRELGEGAESRPDITEDLVADRESRDAGANRDNRSREGRTEDGKLRPKHPEVQAGGSLAFARSALCGSDRRREVANENLTFAWCWGVDLLDGENVGFAVRAIHDGLHDVLLGW